MFGSNYFGQSPFATLEEPLSTSNDAALSESLGAAEVESAALVTAASAAETLSAADSPTATTITAAAGADTLSVADSGTSTVTTAGTVAESVAASDAPTATLNAVASVSETLAAVDQVSGGVTLTATSSETLTAVDTVDSVFAFDRSATDSLAASDSQDAVVVDGVAVSEALAASDHITAAYDTSAARTETGSLQDSESAGVVALRDTSDTLTASDAAQSELSGVGLLAEAVDAFDAVTATLIAVVQVVEVGAASDTLLGGATYPLDVEELLAVFDAADASSFEDPALSKILQARANVYAALLHRKPTIRPVLMGHGRVSVAIQGTVRNPRLHNEVDVQIAITTVAAQNVHLLFGQPVQLVRAPGVGKCVWPQLVVLEKAAGIPATFGIDGTGSLNIGEITDVGLVTINNPGFSDVPGQARVVVPVVSPAFLADAGVDNVGLEENAALQLWSDADIGDAAFDLTVHVYYLIIDV